MNSAGNSSVNFTVWLATTSGTVAMAVLESWYIILMASLGIVHAYVAWKKYKRDELEAEYVRKDRELTVLREVERERLLKEQEEKLAQNKITQAQQETNEKKRDKDLKNRRSKECINPKKTRNSIRSVGAD